MKTEEILQGNRILAEFMEFIKPYGDVYQCCFGNINNTTSPDCMRFCKSWDWLMPVVEKILNICQESDEMEEYYIITDAIPEIESVFSACVKFAELYKNQSKQIKA